MSALRKVLVVDDDPVVGKSFDRVLAAKGYSVITASGAAEALARLREAEVDLVVTDIRMPGMDGLELAETLHSRRPWTPVLIITGYGTEADEARARAAGVSAFLHKPLSPETIADSTAQALADADAIVAVGALAAAEARTVVEPAVQAPARGGWLKNVALFFAAPFVGLAYILAMPFVGLGMLVWMGGKALARRNAERGGAPGAFATVAKMVFMPIVGLAYIIVLPFAGIATLAWFAVRKALGRAQAE